MLRLIGHCQAGREPNPELILQPGPLAKFDSGSTPALSPTILPLLSRPSSVLQRQSSGSGSIQVPPLTTDMASKFTALFERARPQDGILPGEIAKQIFELSGLPNAVLGRIWNLVDTEERGSLQVTEFVVAFHLLASFKTGALHALPNVLPAELFEVAAGQRTVF
jgi:epidermal growth factor receptor substrate 15